MVFDMEEMDAPKVKIGTAKYYDFDDSAKKSFDEAPFQEFQ